MDYVQVQNVCPNPYSVKKLRKLIEAATKPVMVMGSQAMLPGGSVHADNVAGAVRLLNIPVFLGT